MRYDFILLLKERLLSRYDSIFILKEYCTMRYDSVLKQENIESCDMILGAI